MNLAAELRVLDEGLPNVRLVHSSNSQGTTLMAGEIKDNAVVVMMVQTQTSGMAKDEDSFTLKDTHDEL